MKKYIIVALIIILAAFCFSVPQGVQTRIALAESVDYASFNLVISNDLQNLIELADGEAKTAGSAAEKAVADYINDKMQGLTTFTPNGKEGGFSSFDFVNQSGVLSHSQNVIYLKDNPNTDKKVIIGTHYDTYSSNVEAKTQGVNANLSSVATLLEIARQIDLSEYSMDIEIVFFGAGEVGLYGAYNYTLSLDESAIENIVLMINIEHLLAGDYLNAYTAGNNLETYDYVNNVAQGYNIELKKPIIAYSFIEDDSHIFNREYLHRGLYSNSADFEKLGINTLFFFKGNESDTDAIGKTESKTYADISNTENDTIENIKTLYGEDYILGAYNTAKVINGLLMREDFMSFYGGRIGTKTDVGLIIKTIFFCMAVLLVLFWLVYKLMYFRLFKTAHREACSAQSLNALFNKFSTEVEKVDVDKEMEGSDIGSIRNEFKRAVKKELDIDERKTSSKKSKNDDKKSKDDR